MSFDKILDPTAGVYFYFHNIYIAVPTMTLWSLVEYVRTSLLFSSHVTHDAFNKGAARTLNRRGLYV